MSDSEFKFPLDGNGHVDETARFRVLFDALCYGDLAPEEMQGQIFAHKGDVINFYPELRAYPDRVQILVSKHYVEYVPPPQEYTPRKRHVSALTDNKELVEKVENPQKENE